MEYKVNINFVDGSETNGLCNVNHLFKDCVQAGSMMVEKQWIEKNKDKMRVYTDDKREILLNDDCVESFEILELHV
ncbi:hypothetical protein [Paraclostridium bifermentans]|uniref:hypothetical protein n=1 Tax=Paraclostridium bifermentans TaxID=1490 RepID=UPI0011582481|nr:hypothetical protein [Paraclostridium bifermentans]TQO55652.1 hypothetical protein D5S05_17355 [Paraclostridium bifermentans]